MKRVSVLFSVLAVALLISGCKQPAPAQPDSSNMNADQQMQQNTNDTMDENANMPAQDDTSAAPAPAPAAAPQGPTKTFNVSMANFSFDVKEMKVKKGDTVTVNVKNNEGFHDWVIDDFNTRTKQLKAGESATVTFVADKTGTFEYYCSVGQHRKFGMVGKLIVE